MTVHVDTQRDRRLFRSQINTRARGTMPFRMKELLFLSLLLLLLHSGRVGRTQVAWTPIYVDGNSQVDLWTVSGTGCACPREDDDDHPSTVAPNISSPSKDCACCVKNGGCPCGAASPRRCTQCGLEEHCMQMCNVTIDSRALKARSGKTFGQIKSPSLVGPGSCWYLFLADRNQRIEIQVYRLVSVGHFNGTSCHSGFLELTEGGEAAAVRRGAGGQRSGARGLQLCGENERFAPPAVLFGDRPSATLLLKISETTLRSQFLAYFSFTPSDHSTLGIASRGGKKLDRTECDWIYQEHQCKGKTGRGGGAVGGKGGRGRGRGGGSEDNAEGGWCILASPGHPGVYPPNRVCKYLITTSSMRTRVHLIFTSLLLPYNQCDTDYIAIHKGSSVSSPLLTKICGSRKTQLEFSGPSMLIEFSSGPPLPPYDYNGFAARLEFTEIPEEPPVTEIPVGTSTKSAEIGLLMDETLTGPRRIPNTICDYVFLGNTTRAGQFDTRTKGWLQFPSSMSPSLAPVPLTCKLTFYGRSSDKVHMSLFNYDLRAATCGSSIEIFDGIIGKNAKCIKKICSPLTINVEEHHESISEHKSIVSTGNVLTIVFYRGLESSKEFLDGAFLFHDEHLEGTLQASTLCDVVYDGAKKRSSGTKREGPFAEPVAGRSHQLLWNVEGPLRCSQRFDLAKGQTITLKFTAAERLVNDQNCHTRCQTENGGGGIMDEDLGGGCSCMTDLVPLSQMDHLLILAADGSGSQVSCLCGNFHGVLPIAVKSTTSLLVEYRVSQFSWRAKGFGYKGTYRFDDENACGERIRTEPSGSIDSKTKMKALPAAVRNYYHESCTWLLQSNVERQLNIEMYTSENKPCNVWNVTVLQYRENMLQEESERTADDRIGQILHTFCPKQRKKIFKLPWQQNNVFIRLSSLSNSPAEYSIRWKSQVVQANTRIAAPQDSLSQGSTGRHPGPPAIVISFVVLLQRTWDLSCVTT